MHTCILLLALFSCAFGISVNKVKRGAGQCNRCYGEVDQCLQIPLQGPRQRDNFAHCFNCLKPALNTWNLPEIATFEYSGEKHFGAARGMTRQRCIISTMFTNQYCKECLAGHNEARNQLQSSVLQCCTSLIEL